MVVEYVDEEERILVKVDPETKRPPLNRIQRVNEQQFYKRWKVHPEQFLLQEWVYLDKQTTTAIRALEKKIHEIEREIRCLIKYGATFKPLTVINDASTKKMK